MASQPPPEYFTAHRQRVVDGAYVAQVDCQGLTIDTDTIIAPVPEVLRDLGRVGYVAVIGAGGVSLDITKDVSGGVFLERPGYSLPLVPGEEYSIGRSRESVGSSSLSSTVSRQHARLGVGQRELTITDNGSLNGTGLIYGALAEHVRSREKSSVTWRAAVAEKTVRGEDAHVFDQDRGIFGVFDGAGGMAGAYRASHQARKFFQTERLRHMAPYAFRHESPRTAEIWLIRTLHKASAYLEGDPDAGLTTATVARVVEHRGDETLVWASIGDSRLYIVRNGIVRQLTKDEGVGRFIEKSLGMPGAAGTVTQIGHEPLVRGDVIILVTDGITGDYGSEVVSREELSAWVEHARTPEEAAKTLIEKSRKHDDGTAIVVRIQ